MTTAAAEFGPHDLTVAPTEQEEALLSRAYAAYNTQDVENLLDLLTDDVDWPDGRRRLHGKAAVRAYWTEQWTRTRTHDEPVSLKRRPDGRVAVLIGQVVCALDGAVLSTGRFCHLHRIRGSRIARLDIEEMDG